MVDARRHGHTPLLFWRLTKASPHRSTLTDVPSISCGHCGGIHTSVAQVRACSVPASGAPSESPPTAPSPSARSAAGAARHQTVSLPRDRMAGPAWLGRSLLIPVEEDIPVQWQDAPQVEADAQADHDTIERLHQAWRNRQRLVIRWSGPLPSTVSERALSFHELDPTSEPPGERLLFAATANAVDLLGAVPRFRPLERAVACGALVAPDGTTVTNPLPRPATATEQLQADIDMNDGTAAFVDGGPLDLDVGASVVPRVALTAGRLAPLQVRRSPQAALAPDQLAAVAHRSGPARILAPAGSGKTRVLTERTRHVVHDCGINPRSICLVAYNRRAKDEMRERLADVPGLDIRTLNSLALALAVGTGPFASSRSARSSAPTTIDEVEARIDDQLGEHQIGDLPDQLGDLRGL